jgi:hypothetical protein
LISTQRYSSRAPARAAAPAVSALVPRSKCSRP